jgi:hypothetical protein
MIDTKFVNTKDLENEGLTLLPVRRGCIGMCACTGRCREIIGYVDAKEYREFMKGYISPEEWLTKELKSEINNN